MAAWVYFSTTCDLNFAPLSHLLFWGKTNFKFLFQAKKEPITDELSTVLDAKVTVTANFDVKVEGGKVPDEVRN